MENSILILFYTSKPKKKLYKQNEKNRTDDKSSKERKSRKIFKLIKNYNFYFNL